MDTVPPSPEPAQTPCGEAAPGAAESCPHCGHCCGQAPATSAELRKALLDEVMKAGIDASKDISWQIRCGKTQELAFARVSRAARLTAMLSARLEADPTLKGFRPPPTRMAGDYARRAPSGYASL